MYDFFKIIRKDTKNGIEIYPKFIVKKSKDLMVKGGDFYAVWLEKENKWSTDEDDLIKIIDDYILDYIRNDEYLKTLSNKILSPKFMWDSESQMIDKWHKYCQCQLRDNYHMLDKKLIFLNDEVKREDYSSKQLNYRLEENETPSYNKLISTLYSEEEKHKIEWCIGSIVAGETQNVQKFVVLYGSAGTGKSTILNIIQKLFDGYYSIFDAKSLGNSSNVFALEAFKNNPLVAIQHDGDLSRIEDNTRLNSLVSHEKMTINEKYKSTYTNSFNCFLFMGTNKPVKITDAKSGLIRRLIDVSPTGDKINFSEYHDLMERINFELGGIAWHCREVYLKDPEYYNNYIPTKMLDASNDFYNFVMDHYHIFKNDNGTSLTAAWALYKEYCEESIIPYKMTKRVFKEELKNYFKIYHERYKMNDGNRIRSYYEIFLDDKFAVKNKKKTVQKNNFLDELKKQDSIFDKIGAKYLAQYTTKYENPKSKWKDVKTKLKDLDTSILHFVKLPENHIVIDFDIKNKNGEKDILLNVKAASKFPETYCEVSKGGNGLHLHYFYNGDVDKLSRVYDKDIEVKVFKGNSSLRRKLTLCNNKKIATINSGLPLKEERRLDVVDKKTIQNEKHLIIMIKKCLAKEIFDNTTPNVYFIKKLLDEAYASDIVYDVAFLKEEIIAFAAQSTNQSDTCLKLIKDMHFSSKNENDYKESSGELAFFDIEIYPNLFLLCYNVNDGDQVIKMFNPSSTEVENFIKKYKIIGFNNRKYDNHLLYARLMGSSIEDLFNISSRIISSRNKSGDKKYLFREAYNISYTDVYDYSSKKQSLKKWEIELDIPHQELDFPWDQPIDKKNWETVAKYCENDVLATKAVFNATQPDFLARKILADLADSNVNTPTNTLTTKIIFGNDKKPELSYCDLKTGEIEYLNQKYKKSYVINEFPDYNFTMLDDNKWHNMYKDEDVSFGGYVYTEPNIYYNVALLDIASMHPHSAINMDYFGKYTKLFEDLVKVRILIKHGKLNEAKKLFNGKLNKFLENEELAKQIPYALKIAINSVYGLTSAKFDNAFHDDRNKNNIVALRGALFMITLREEVQKQGFTVAHIKTDSIKIPDATPSIINFCMEFAKKYGYTFEHEATYDRMCLVNKAVYIAKYKSDIECKKYYGYIPEKNQKYSKQWTATGTQFQVPYVFKTLFSKEDLDFKDMCVTQQVTTSIYLDYNENLKEDEHDYKFIGKIGSFCPIKAGCGGGLLKRISKDKTKYDYLSGAKGYRWNEASFIKMSGMYDDVDNTYFIKLIDDAIKAIEKYGDFKEFVEHEEEPFLFS